MALLLNGTSGGSPELLVGATLQSTQPLRGRLGFLELEAASSDTNILGVGSAAEGLAPALAPSDDPFLSGALLLGIDLKGPGTGLVPLADIGQLELDPLAKVGFEIDPKITASLGSAVSIDGEMLFGGYGELGDSGFNFSLTPFVFRPGEIKVNLGEDLVAASGPFIKIAQFLNEYFLDPLEPLVDILETEFSIAGLNLLGDGRLHNLIDIGIDGNPNGAVTSWVNLYNDINQVVDAVARLQDSDQLVIPSWLFLPADLHTIVAGPAYSGPDAAANPFRTNSLDGENRNAIPNANSPQGVLQDAVNTLTGALGNGRVGANTNNFSSPDIGRTEVTFPFLDFSYTSSRLINLLMGTEPASRYELDLIRLQIQGFSTSWGFQQTIGPIYAPPPVNLEVGASITPYIRPTVLGYDLTGLAGLIETGELMALADGFYVLDDEPGNLINGSQYPGAGAELRIEVSGGVSVGLPILKVRGDAHIRGTLEIELNDHNGDGRVRFQELFDNFSYNPLAIFDAAIRVALSASIGVEVGISPFKVSFTIYETPEFELFSIEI